MQKYLVYLSSWNTRSALQATQYCTHSRWYCIYSSVCCSSTQSGALAHRFAVRFVHWFDWQAVRFQHQVVDVLLLFNTSRLQYEPTTNYSNIHCANDSSTNTNHTFIKTTTAKRIHLFSSHYKMHMLRLSVWGFFHWNFQVFSFSLRKIEIINHQPDAYQKVKIDNFFLILKIKKDCIG